MKMSRVARLALAAGLACFVLAAPTKADTLDDIRAAKKVRIAIDLAIPPFGMTDEKMQPTGSDVDLAKALAKDLDAELEIVPTTGPSRIPALQTGKADLVVSTLSITPERAKVVDFSIPYADHLSVVAALKDIAIKDYADLTGKRVAVVRGTTQDTDLTKLAKDAQIVRYEDDSTMSLAVASGQADILATARSLLPAINKKNPARTVETKIVMQTNLLGIGMRQNEPKLKEWVNGWVKANLKNRKLDEIYKAYHGIGVAPEILKAGDS
jgi:polar amino acid transport system substrate-binding protein